MSIDSHNEFTELFKHSGLGIPEVAKILDASERTVRRYLDGTTRRIGNLKLEKMREIANSRGNGNQSVDFRFIDLFAGIGGIRIPFEEIGGRCVFTAERDRYCQETYRANFPEKADSGHIMADDIEPWAKEPEKIPPHDVLLAGFPCQPFSIAGVSKKNALGRPHGFLCDTQGSCFYELARIISHHRPPAFLLENVKNLERHDSGNTFSTIMNVLRHELNYSVFHKVISSAPWVPQKRERIFIVGFKYKNIEFDFNQLAVPDGCGPTIGSILDDEVDQKYTLTEHMWSYLQAYREKHRKAGNGFGYSAFGPNEVARTLSARYHKDGSEILIKQEGGRPRRLTPRECARLMGFEKPGQAEWQIPVSDTQAYRQFGNAVVVSVVRAVAQLMQSKIVDAMELDNRQVSPTIQLSLPLPAP